MFPSNLPQHACADPHKGFLFFNLFSFYLHRTESECLYVHDKDINTVKSDKNTEILSVTDWQQDWEQMSENKTTASNPPALAYIFRNLVRLLSLRRVFSFTLSSI